MLLLLQIILLDLRDSSVDSLNVSFNWNSAACALSPLPASRIALVVLRQSRSLSWAILSELIEHHNLICYPIGWHWLDQSITLLIIFVLQSLQIWLVKDLHFICLNERLFAIDEFASFQLYFECFVADIFFQVVYLSSFTGRRMSSLSIGGLVLWGLVKLLASQSSDCCVVWSLSQILIALGKGYSLASRLSRPLQEACIWILLKQRFELGAVHLVLAENGWRHHCINHILVWEWLYVLFLGSIKLADWLNTKSFRSNGSFRVLLVLQTRLGKLAS